MAGTAAAATRPAVEAAHGMVVSAQRLASEVGVEILEAGGNAVDAAVAVGYAEAVVNPCCGNIGGGGFLVLRLADGREAFINFRETAPAAATENLYLDARGKPVEQASRLGWKAAGVPGTVAGLEAALTAYGTMSRAQVMAPAIRLARDGFVLTRFDTDILGFATELFRRDPEAARIFLRPDTSPLQPGDRLVQRDLARTLERIAADGSAFFYQGPVARAVAAASAAGGGILTPADFAQYRTTQSSPIHCAYRGYQIASAPPPSSGGVTLCEMLDILSGYDLKSMGFGSAAAIHVIAEAMRHAYRDRNVELGDPAFVENPLQRLLSADYAASIRAAIPPERATPSKDLPAQDPPPEKAETTHYSIVDKNGNAVAITYTLNGGFGAGVMAPGTGFFINDEMDDFAVAPDTPNMFGLIQGKANAIAPGKRPLSSMTPTIVTRDGKLAFVLGSPGGSRITTAVLLTLLDLIDFDMRPEEAVDAPRIHQQWLPDTVFAERFAIAPDARRMLAADGYSITDARPGSDVELIEVGPPAPADAAHAAGNGVDTALSGALTPGLLYGANDDRRPAGAAVGY